MTSVSALLDEWVIDPRKKQQIQSIHVIEPRESQTVPFPEDLNETIKAALTSRGITELYTHQASSYLHARNGNSITTITPTASGKSLCYHLPVLQSIAEDPKSRAIYLFPTKALAQDQKSDLNHLIEATGMPIGSYTYDGDTEPGIRRKVRTNGNIILTNPDMLHSGILPHHTKWVAMFENLKYIIVDEMHTYKGVFGTHVAHVLRRLRRICQFYGSNPVFICTSATIRNPKELAEKLTNTTHTLIDNNGAPSGTKYFLFYNPPVIHPTYNVRRSAVLEVRDLAEELYKKGLQTIIFGKSRVRVEMLVTYLKALVSKKLNDKSIRGYRGGYLPSERREIEKGLRNGEIRTVVSTNALELGVDIGQLQVCIMTGYPGNVASAWQQAGRAGRRQGESLVIYVAQSTALDQYVVDHPDYLLGQSPEEVRIFPENMLILMDHMKCAAFELPFSKDEHYAEFYSEPLLDFLKEENVVLQTANKWHWMAESFPASNISLRSASQDNVIIVDQTTPTETRVIGEMDLFSAMTLLHEEAIYLHQGAQFQVEVLDWDEKKAYVTEVDVDYFTDANIAVEMKVISNDRSKQSGRVELQFGDIIVLAHPTLFKKIKFDTHDNIGSGPINLPPLELHTSAVWATFEKPQQANTHLFADAMVGAAYALHSFIPLFLDCDHKDVHVVPQIKSVLDEKPTFFIYDSYPGGIGLAERMMDRFEELVEESIEQISVCPCLDGCPACIGAQEANIGLKQEVIALLNELVRA
ncbi:DEAD/DEAH box helicase [Chryseomicrobium palamuruense]|uniref:DEAD/DEAH box helicase n=1 Tax=Chryseomicrobium palamuruense TaxID=682973 RepID=A0ABV8UTI8_9BACL